MTLPSLNQVIFFDIETAPMAKNIGEMPDNLIKLWEHKSDKAYYELDPRESFKQNSSFFAEFSKVVCISVGVFHNGTLIVKAIAGDNEEVLLGMFTETLDKIGHNKSLCGHNIIEFDLPYMCRKYLMYSKPIPNILDITGLKPWEVRHVDTMKLWQFGSFAGKTSLDLMAQALGFPSPKSDMDGSKVGEAYWNGELDRIKEYNVQDVVTVAKCFLRFRGEKTDFEVIVK